MLNHQIPKRGGFAIAPRKHAGYAVIESGKVKEVYMYYDTALENVGGGKIVNFSWWAAKHREK